MDKVNISLWKMIQNAAYRELSKINVDPNTLATDKVIEGHLYKIMAYIDVLSMISENKGITIRKENE